MLSSRGACSTSGRAPHQLSNRSSSCLFRADRHVLKSTRASVSGTSAVEAYITSLEACEVSGDTLRAIEVFTEARILKLDLPHASIEAGIRILSNGGQWQRAVEMYDRLEASPSAVTVDALFAALAAGQQADVCLRLLQDHVRLERPALPKVYNVTTRSLAKAGQLDQALELLQEMTKHDKVAVDHQTFDILAIACLKAGRADEASEVLEARDYL